MGHFQNMSKSETDKARKTKYDWIYPFMHIVSTNPGLMIITNVDKNQ